MFKELIQCTPLMPCLVYDDYREQYPGQTYFWFHNQNVAQAELSFEVKRREQEKHSLEREDGQ